MAHFKKALIAFALVAGSAHAQMAIGVNVVSACGTPNGSTYTTGQVRYATMDTTGKFCTSGTGGGSSNTVWGPVAVGSAQTEPPVMIGGTATGASNGTTQIVTIKPAATASVSNDTALVIDANPAGSLAGLFADPTPAGNNIIGKVGIDQTTPGTTNGVQTLTGSTTATTASASGGSTPYTLASAATTNATNVKSTAGQIYELDAQNNGTTEAYLLMFNSGSTPTCTGTPVHIFQIPAVSSVGNAVGGFVIPYSYADFYSSGIGFCITTAIGGTGSVAASQVTVNISYK